MRMGHPGGVVLRCLIVVVLASTGEAVAQHFPPPDDLAKVLRFVVEDGPAPGAVLGVFEADGTTSFAVHGSAGAGAPPLSAGSTFEIGSITKTFTATLFADMVLRGEVGLDDPLSLHLPEDVSVPARFAREITLLDLATHHSGLPDTPPEMQVGVAVPEDPYTHEDAYEFLRTYELPHIPGATREYSNFGYALLGHALALAAGESFEDLVESRILGPLGMTDTGFSQDTTRGAWTRGSRNGSAVRYRPDWRFVAPSGGLYSTAWDLLRYVQAYVAPVETPLHEAMRFAYEMQVPDGPPGAGHGLAWTIAVLPGEAAVVTHSGGTAGYGAQLSFLPDQGTGTVLLTNGAELDDNVAMTMLLFDPPPAQWRSAVPSRSALERYVGEYASTQGNARFHIELTDDGILTYRPGDRARTPLMHRSDGTFYLLRAPITVTFSENADGRIELEMQIDEREPTQRRVMQRAVRLAP